MITNKQAGTYTDEATVGNWLRGLNPMQNFTAFPGKYYVPKSFKLTDDPKVNAMAYQASLIGGTALVLSFLGRGLFNKTVTEEVKADRIDKLDKTLSASNPKFDPEPITGKPSVADYAKGHDFTHQVRDLRKDMTPRLIKVAGMLEETATMAVPLAALYLGTVGGYQLADNVYNWNYKRKLTKDINKSQKLLDAINYQRLLEARKTPAEIKQELAAELEKKQPKALPSAMSDTMQVPGMELAKQADPKTGENQGYFAAAGSVLGMLMLSTALTSTIVSKRYFDSQDPDRAAESATKAALLEMSKQEQADMPANIQPLDADLVNTLNSHLKNIKHMPENPIRPTQSVPIDTQESAFKL